VFKENEQLEVETFASMVSMCKSQTVVGKVGVQISVSKEDAKSSPEGRVLATHK